MNISFILPLLLLVSCSFVYSSKSRKLSMVVNPNCDKKCEHMGLNDTDYNNIVHVIGDGEKDSIHYVWSSVGAPAILVAHTAKNVDLKVDWNKLIAENSSDALHFTGKVYYSFATIMTRLFEYNDKSKDAKFINNEDTITYNLNELTWENINENITSSSNKVCASFTTSNGSKEMLNSGKIVIKMLAFGDKDRQKEMPHQLWTANSSLIDFTIDGLKGSYEHSRFVAEMAFISFDNSKNKTMKNIEYEVKNTIDDEYTPSVFKTYNLKSAEARMADNGGYMQWTPISYLTSKRKYKDSTAIKISNFDKSLDIEEIPFSVPTAFYGEDIFRANFANLTISFGVAKGKDFYTTTNYSTWTVVVGYGTPPDNKISLTVILVITIGLGLPLVVLLGGCSFVIFKKLKGDNRSDMLIVNVDD